MKDPRIEINPTLRKLGFFVGFAMIVAGLVIGWIRSGQNIQLPPTGYKKK